MMSIPGRADKCEMERERDFPSVEARAETALLDRASYRASDDRCTTGARGYWSMGI
jgi:hypothetical protein